MNILNPLEFMATKKSDTMVIYGCGWSLNTMPLERKMKLREFDSIAFNAFYKGGIKTTHYLIRENNSTDSRTGPGETLKEFYDAMNGQYLDATKIVLSEVHVDYKHDEHLDLIPGSGIVVRDFKKRMDTDCDLFEEGCCHWEMTLTNAVHVAKYLGYDRIIFAGVDLYDSRYYWLGKNEDRFTLAEKGKRAGDTHATARNALRLIKKLKRPNTFVENPKSMLALALKVWDGK